MRLGKTHLNPVAAETQLRRDSMKSILTRLNCPHQFNPRQFYFLKYLDCAPLVCLQATGNNSSVSSYLVLLSNLTNQKILERIPT